MFKTILFLTLAILSFNIFAADTSSLRCNDKPTICVIESESDEWNRTAHSLKNDNDLIKTYYGDSGYEAAVKAALKLEAAKICIFVE